LIRVDEVEAVCLAYGCLELTRGQPRSDVNQCPRGRRHRDPIAFREIATAQI
jgi:hypothetical protein